MEVIMIILTLVNGKEICLNDDLIYKIEEAPDTIITLTDGKVLRVANKTEEIIEKTIEYKRKIYTNLLGGSI
jgi:flagellar protein FlbD